MCDILPDLRRAELVQRAFEVTRQILDGADSGTRGTLGVITTLEFFEHHFS
jgi:hypothetical protein